MDTLEVLGRRYRPRVVDSPLERALAISGAVVIEGARATGKTMTALHAASSYVLLDDPESRQILDVAPRSVIVLNMMIGLIHPPFGMLLFVTKALTGIPIGEMVREGWPFSGRRRADVRNLADGLRLSYTMDVNALRSRPRNPPALHSAKPGSRRRCGRDPKPLARRPCARAR